MDTDWCGLDSQNVDLDLDLHLHLHLDLDIACNFFH